jgi:hypothetical protein
VKEVRLLPKFNLSTDVIELCVQKSHEQLV